MQQEQNQQTQFAARLEIEQSAEKLEARVLVLDKQSEQESAVASSTMLRVSSKMQGVATATAALRQELEQLKGEDHRIEQEQRTQLAARLELEQLTTKLGARVLVLEKQEQKSKVELGARVLVLEKQSEQERVLVLKKQEEKESAQQSY